MVVFTAASEDASLCPKCQSFSHGIDLKMSLALICHRIHVSHAPNNTALSESPLISYVATTLPDEAVSYGPVGEVEALDAPVILVDPGGPALIR